MNSSDILAALSCFNFSVECDDLALVSQFSTEELICYLTSKSNKTRCLDEPQNIRACVERASQMLEQCIASRILWTHPLRLDYPHAFRGMPFGPMILFYIGRPVWNERRCLSVVGSREPTHETLRWMTTHLRQVVQLGRVVLVSGAARGVDQFAHEICINQSLPTVAFLPSGLNMIYPKDFVPSLQDIVVNGGAVVSEFPPDRPMLKYHFQRRNRLIAGVSGVTVVVQAARKSGTLMTANHARDYGRTVMVVPGAPWDAKFQGSVDLICDGATPVQDFLDLQLALQSVRLF